jgi:hypothetical protein
MAEHGQRIGRRRRSPSRDPPRSPDHRPSYSDFYAARPHASGYRLRCAGFATKSAKKARHLSGKPENLLTKAHGWLQFRERAMLECNIDVLSLR